MLDEFRNQTDESSFDETGQIDASAVARQRQYFLGMTPAQRFVIAIMLLMMACILSAFCLLVTEKIYPTFLY
jgi:hypothetical protein